MTVPVVWLSYRDGITARETWDTDQVTAITDRQWWWPVDALDYSHHEGFDQLPPRSDGAVVVLGAQHHAAYVDRLNADLARLRWVVLVLAGDECSLFPWAAVEHPNMRLWIMTPRPHVHGDSGAFFLGEGYHRDTLPMLRTLSEEATDARRLSWSFAGQITHSRRRAMEQAVLAWARGGMATMPAQFLPTPGFTLGLPRINYLRLMLASKVVLCPSGPGTPDSFRLYEALEAGCVPIADAFTPEGWPGYWPLVYGDVPFPVIEDWSTLPDVMADVLREWPERAVRCSAWWTAQKRRMVYRLDDDVRAVRDR